MTRPTITIALAGNPNSGKTTIFNAIDRHAPEGRQLAGGDRREEGRPGAPPRLRSEDRGSARHLQPDPLFHRRDRRARFHPGRIPDVVIDIIDTSNLERSLYLATQLRELDCKVVFALNMMDMADARGLKIDARKLSELLDLPVILTVGNKQKGIDDLLAAAVELALSGTPPLQKRKVRYNQEVEKAIDALQRLSDHPPGRPPCPTIRAGSPSN